MKKKLNEKITSMISEAIQEAKKKTQTQNNWSSSDLLNDTETAKILGIAKGTLPVWRHKGKGPKYAKIGSSVRYRYSALQEFIEENTCR